MDDGRWERGKEEEGEGGRAGLSPGIGYVGTVYWLAVGLALGAWIP
jgi:hypothetical protein